MPDKAVVILSGGLDSTTCMAVAADEGFDIYALTFDYGQRHRREVDCARRVAAHFGAREHRIVNLDFLKQIGGSSLTDSRMDIPSGGAGDDIPNTYVPGRNLIFLSLAASFAEVIGARAIFIGVSAVDYSGYPDCRPQFIEAVNRVLRVGTRAGDRSGTDRNPDAPHPFVEGGNDQAGTSVGRSLSPDNLLLPGRGAGLRGVRQLPAPAQGIPRSGNNRSDPL